MFNPFKTIGDLKSMRDQAMVIQKQLSEEIMDVSKNGYTLTISGDQKVKSITKDGVEVLGLTDAVNEAIKKSQEVAAKKLSQMSGGLQGLLGQ